MLRRQVFALLSAAAVLSLVPIAPASAQSKEISLAVTDVVGLESLQREYGPFRDMLQSKTGLKINFVPVTSRTAAVEAMNSKKLDFVLTGPAEYVVFRKRTNAEPVVGLSRPDYFSILVTIAGRGINLPGDLKGKKVSFGDVGSTSQHLGPMQLLADYGIDPRKDVQALHINRNIAIEALKKGDIAAAAMNDTHLKVIREKDTTTPYEVIARTRDLPNDILLAGPHVDKAVVDNVRKAFTEHSAALIDSVVGVKENRKYLGMVFLPTVKDADYNYVRSMYRTIGYPEYAEFIGN
jgi:phosphonate transport system substrate-binding protein